MSEGETTPEKDLNHSPPPTSFSTPQHQIAWRRDTTRTVEDEPDSKRQKSNEVSQKSPRPVVPSPLMRRHIARTQGIPEEKMFNLELQLLEARRNYDELTTALESERREFQAKLDAHDRELQNSNDKLQQQNATLQDAENALSLARKNEMEAKQKHDDDRQKQRQLRTDVEHQNRKSVERLGEYMQQFNQLVEEKQQLEKELINVKSDTKLQDIANIPPISPNHEKDKLEVENRTLQLQIDRLETEIKIFETQKELAPHYKKQLDEVAEKKKQYDSTLQQNATLKQRSKDYGTVQEERNLLRIQLKALTDAQKQYQHAEAEAKRRQTAAEAKASAWSSLFDSRTLDEVRIQQKRLRDESLASLKEKGELKVKITALELQKKFADEKSQNATTSLTQKTEALNTLQRQYDELDLNYVKVSRQLEDTEKRGVAKAQTSANEMFRAQITKVNNDNASLAKANTTLLADVTKLKQEKTTFQEQATKLQEEKDAWLKLRDGLIKKARELTTLYDEQKKLKQKAQEEVTTLKQQVEENTAKQSDSKDAEFTSLKTKCDELTKALETAKLRITAESGKQKPLQEKIGELERIIEQQEEETKTQKETIQKQLQDETAKLKEQIAETKKQCLLLEKKSKVEVEALRTIQQKYKQQGEEIVKLKSDQSVNSTDQEGDGKPKIMHLAISPQAQLKLDTLAGENSELKKTVTSLQEQLNNMNLADKENVQPNTQQQPPQQQQGLCTNASCQQRLDDLQRRSDNLSDQRDRLRDGFQKYVHEVRGAMSTLGWKVGKKGTQFHLESPFCGETFSVEHNEKMEGSFEFVDNSAFRALLRFREEHKDLPLGTNSQLIVAYVYHAMLTKASSKVTGSPGPLRGAE